MKNTFLILISLGSLIGLSACGRATGVALSADSPAASFALCNPLIIQFENELAATTPTVTTEAEMLASFAVSGNSTPNSIETDPDDAALHYDLFLITASNGAICATYKVMVQDNFYNNYSVVLHY